MQNLEKFPLTHCHSFTYSKRDGTPSATMKPQINGAVAKQRLKELDEIIKRKNFEFRQKQKSLDILIESQKDGIYIGYDQFFNPIEVTSHSDIVGDWIVCEEYEVKENNNVSQF